MFGPRPQRLLVSVLPAHSGKIIRKQKDRRLNNQRLSTDDQRMCRNSVTVRVTMPVSFRGYGIRFNFSVTEQRASIRVSLPSPLHEFFKNWSLGFGNWDFTCLEASDSNHPRQKQDHYTGIEPIGTPHFKSAKPASSLTPPVAARFHRQS